MTSSSERDAKGAPRPASPYTRFIPREELRGFAAWQPGAFDGVPPRASSVSAPSPAPEAAAPPAPPTEAQWAQRIEEARRAGLQEGYQNGYRDGLVALESFKQSLATQSQAQVGALVQAIDREIEALQPELARAVTRVAVDLARQVLRQELHARPEVVAAVATQAVQGMLLTARHITVQLNPQDIPLVAEGAADTLQLRHARLVGNANLARGDCVVESDLGSIDARVSTLWAQATAGLPGAEGWTVDDAAPPPSDADDDAVPKAPGEPA
jgi:flagellar assembly protein FliH